MAIKPASKEQMRESFIDNIKNTISYWSTLKGVTEEERCEGVAHSILKMIDGNAGGFKCSIDLVLRSYQEDKEYFISQGEDYVEDGMVINDDTQLCHRIFLK